MRNTVKNHPSQLTNQQKMAQGSAWMTIGNVGSRLIGVIYIIPWYYWLGENANTANALFNMGYNIYALFIMIATAGIPSAIAKQIAYHHSRQEYRVSQKLFKRALQAMIVLGVISAAIMYLAAPALSRGAGGGDDLIPAMRSLSAAILVIPAMSVIRGYFQGTQNVGPFAISQLVEQIARVIYMLSLTFYIMKLGDGDYVAAVTQSTFGAFIGALASLAILGYYYMQEKVRLELLLEIDQSEAEIQTTELLITIVRQAIPLIVLGAGITIFKLIDQYTFVHVMHWFSEYTNKQLLDLMALFTGNPDKLTMVVIGLSTGMSLVGLPLITESFAKKDAQELSKLVTNNLQLYSFVMFPATFGMILLAYPLNTIFYAPSVLGSHLLIVACLSGLVLGLFIITSSMLAGIYQNTAAIIYFLIGLGVKLVLQVPMIYLLESYGPLISTTIGMAVICYLNLRRLQALTKFHASLVYRRTLLIFILTGIMFLFAGLAKWGFGQVLSIDRGFTSFVLVLIVAAVGGSVYSYLVLKLRLADRLLGTNMQRFRRKLYIK